MAGGGPGGPGARGSGGDRAEQAAGLGRELPAETGLDKRHGSKGRDRQEGEKGHPRTLAMAKVPALIWLNPILGQSGKYFLPAGAARVTFPPG